MLRFDPNPDAWRRVHLNGGEFLDLAYIGPETTQSAVEARWRQLMPDTKLMFRPIPSASDDLHEQTPPLPFEVSMPR